MTILVGLGIVDLIVRSDREGLLGAVERAFRPGDVCSAYRGTEIGHAEAVAR